MAIKICLVLTALSVSVSQAWATCDFGVDTCKQGLVFRDAFPNDRVCVGGTSRNQAQADNQQGPSRKMPGSQDCIFGYVWREASPSDFVCVPGAVRNQTRAENGQVAANRDPTCSTAGGGTPGGKLEWAIADPAANHPIRKTVTKGDRFNPDGSPRPTATVQSPLSGLTDRMWDVGQTLKVFMTGGGPIIRSKVRDLSQEWTRYANIRFEFVDRIEGSQIRIEFRDDGHWSKIGRDANLVPFYGQTMNLALNDASGDTVVRRVVLHEFGHALGMIHEHQSPAAGIPWNKPAVYREYAQLGWSQADTDHNVFNRYSATVTNYSRYDPTSIMSYSWPSSHTLDGSTGRENFNLSPIDKQFVSEMYPFPSTDKGVLRVGGAGCHEVAYAVTYDAERPDTVRFSLGAANPFVDWEKRVEIPVDGSAYQGVQIHRGIFSPSWPRDQVIAVSQIDKSRQIKFAAAGVLGVVHDTGYRWDALPSIPGGSWVQLDWAKQRC